ncbi:MAG: hypothetical protein LBR33_07015 [Propionibacteriaceae bacterium]|nr:hypothetical protein [Propionibacteriaceae bacterium]
MAEPRVRYGDLIEYDTPDSLDDLHGPVTGTVRVKPHIDTSPNPVYDLTDPARLRSLYGRLVRDGTPREQVALLNKSTLFRLWPDLTLPERCRTTWTLRFPQLLLDGGLS